MSYYVAKVGEIIIKPEYRKDFGYMFRGEHDMLGEGIISDFIKECKDTFIPFCHWKHYDEKEHWKGKYITLYNEETGYLSYGITYNHHGNSCWTMIELFKLLKIITEKTIFHDGWTEE